MRKAAARDKRGTMSGLMVVTGMGRARKGDLPLVLERPLTVEERSEERSEVPRPRWDFELGETFWYSKLREESEGGRELSDVSGSSLVGKGGEDTNIDRICTSAVCSSGEPMTAFCFSDIPYSARREFGDCCLATAGSGCPMRSWKASTASALSSTYTQTGPLEAHGSAAGGHRGYCQQLTLQTTCNPPRTTQTSSPGLSQYRSPFAFLSQSAYLFVESC